MTTKWEPNLKKVKLKRSRKGALDMGFQKLCDLNTKYNTSIKYLSDIKDYYGKIAINLNKYVLVAKNYPYGFMVSVDEMIVNYCKNQNKKLLLYLKSSNNIYEFDPTQIIQYGEPNQRGKSTMLNFKIQLGQNFEKVAENQLKAKQSKMF